MFNVIMRRVSDGIELPWKRALDGKQALAITKHMNHLNDETARLLGHATVKFIYFVREIV